MPFDNKQEEKMLDNLIDMLEGLKWDDEEIIVV